MTNSTILHSVQTWLPLTMVWVYNQIKYADAFRPVVICEWIDEPERFPVKPVLQASTAWLPALLRKVQRKLGWRYTPAAYDRAVEEYRPQLIHSHFGDRGWGDRPLARRHLLPHVVTFYGYDVNMLVRQNPVWRMRYAEMFREIDMVLCEGPFMREKIVELGCPDEKARVQRLGVEVEKIRYKPRRREEDEVRILIAGAFREKKGIPYALEAVGRLVERGGKLKVTVFGDAGHQEREQAEKRRIMEVIARYRLENIVTLRGFQPYSLLLDEAYRHHIFLSPSVTSSDGDTEGGAPVSLIDMAATGMPIVSSLHCDIPQVVLDRKTGYLAPERDVEALTEALKTCIDRSSEWGAMAQAARQHVEEKFSVAKLGKELEQVYLSLGKLA